MSEAGQQAAVAQAGVRPGRRRAGQGQLSYPTACLPSPLPPAAPMKQVWATHRHCLPVLRVLCRHRRLPVVQRSGEQTL